MLQQKSERANPCHRIEDNLLYGFPGKLNVDFLYRPSVERLCESEREAKKHRLNSYGANFALPKDARKGSKEITRKKIKVHRRARDCEQRGGRNQAKQKASEEARRTATEAGVKLCIENSEIAP
jgi:hypothetical protein